MLKPGTVGTVDLCVWKASTGSWEFGTRRYASLLASTQALVPVGLVWEYREVFQGRGRAGNDCFQGQTVRK